MKISKFWLIIVLFTTFSLSSNNVYSLTNGTDNLKNSAYKAYKGQRFGEAIGYFEQIISKEKIDDNLRMAFAYSLFANKQYSKAFKEFNHIIQFSKNKEMVNYSRTILPSIIPKIIYSINRTIFYHEYDLLRNSPQSNAITLNEVNQPIGEVLKKVKELSGNDVEWGGNFKSEANLFNISISSFNAPFWSVIAEICKEGNWSFEVLSQPGSPVRIPWMSDTPVIKNFSVHGPAMLAWYGLTNDDFFSDKNKSKKFFKLRLIFDPKSSLSVEGVDLKPDMFFSVNGKKIVVKPDKESQDGTGGREWKIEPDKKITGKNVDLEVPVTLWVPTRLNKDVKLKWQNESVTKVKDLKVTLKGIKTYGETVSFNVSWEYDKAILEKDKKELGIFLNKINSENRIPNEQEKLIISQLQGGGKVISLKGNVYIVNGDGSKVEIKNYSGGGHPLFGYSYSFQADLKDLKDPEAIIFTWEDTNKPVKVTFKINNLIF